MGTCKEIVKHEFEVRDRQLASVTQLVIALNRNHGAAGLNPSREQSVIFFKQNREPLTLACLYEDPVHYPCVHLEPTSATPNLKEVRKNFIQFFNKRI